MAWKHEGLHPSEPIGFNGTHPEHLEWRGSLGEWRCTWRRACAIGRDAVRRCRKAFAEHDDRVGQGFESERTCCLYNGTTLELQMFELHLLPQRLSTVFGKAEETNGVFVALG